MYEKYRMALLYCWLLFLSVLFTNCNGRSAVLSEDEIALDVTNYTEVALSKKLYVYRDYSDAQFYHFNVPRQALSANFRLSSQGSSDCENRQIIVYAQPGSFPVINSATNGITSSLWTNNADQIYTAYIWSNEEDSIEISFPRAGSWYLMAIIDEDFDTYSQGFGPICDVSLKIEASYEILGDVTTLATAMVPLESPTNHDFEIAGITYFSFFVPPMVWSAEINLESCTIENTTSPDLSISASIRPSGLPLESNENTLLFNCSESSSICNLTITPQEETYYYFSITPNSVDDQQCLSIAVSIEVCSSDVWIDEDEGYIIQEINDRKAAHTHNAPFNHILDTSTNTKRSMQPFIEGSREKRSVDYHHLINARPASSNSEMDPLFKTLPKSLTEDEYWPRYKMERVTYEEEFSYGYTLDGTLDIVDDSPVILTFQIHPGIDTGGTLMVAMEILPGVNESTESFYVIGCLSLNVRDELGDRGVKCSKGHTLIVERIHDESNEATVYVPYPEAGTWFITLHPTCTSNVKSENSSCSSSVPLNVYVSSEACVDGQCGKYGSCYLVSTSGMIYSACVCQAGYQGYECTDDSEAKTDGELLASALLLTMSNLFFIPAAILAIQREFYTEALLYTSVLFFSTFYHACDQVVYDFCMMPYSVLQFADYYTATLALFITLITMANLPKHTIPVFHMIGALIVAIGVEYNKDGPWVYGVPCLAAFFIMAIAWLYHTLKRNTIFPPVNYWLKGLLPGLTLGAVGLICYAFLETEDNYYWVHSLWHSLMAFSILLLLPPKKMDGWNMDIKSPRPDPVSANEKSMQVIQMKHLY